MFSSNKPVDLREYLQVLVRRGWLIIVPAVVALGVAFVASMPRFLPPVYESSSKMVLEFPQPLSRRMAEIVSQPSGREQFARLSNLVYSSEFLKQVIRQTGMSSDAKSRAWAQRQRTKYPSMTEDGLVDLYLMRYLRGALDAGAGRREPNVFRVVVRDYYPRRAVEVCQAITDGVIAASKSITAEQMKATADFALEQVAVYRERIEDKKRELREYEQGGVRRTIAEGPVNDASVAAVRNVSRSAEAQVRDARIKREELSREIQRLGEDPERWLHMIRPPSVEEATIHYLSLVRERAGAELQDLTAELSGGGGGGTTTSLSVQLASKRRDMRRSCAEMIVRSNGGQNLSGNLKDAILDLLIADLDARSADRRRTVIREELQRYERHSALVPERELYATQLRQDLNTLEDLFLTFKQQIAAANVAEAFEAQKVGGRLDVLEPPNLPLEPVSPNRAMIFVLAALGGLFLGILIVFLVEYHDLTIKDVDELPERLRARVLGSLPVIRDRVRKEREYRKAGMKGSWIPIFDYYRDEAPSSFEFRRVVLDLCRDGGNPPRSIMVTSSERAEGKTTTACFLGLTLARHRKLRTVVVDLDFRKPSVHGQLGLAKHAPGAAEALVERRLERDTIRPTAEGNLFVLPAGSFRSISVESVTPESVRWLITELGQWFDVVVVDSPPNLAVPDPLVIGQAVEAVLFVVKAGSTSKRVLERGFELQERANENVVGILLNNVRNVMPYYYSYEHYGYGAELQPQPAVSEESR